MKSIQTLEGLLSARASSWSGRSIREVYDAESFSEGEPELAEHLLSHRAEVLSWLQTREADQEAMTFFDTPAAFLARKTQEWLQTQNQFLTLGASSMPALSRLYQQSLASMTTLLAKSQSIEALQSSLAGLFASHHEGFVDFLDDLDRASGLPGFIFQRAICAEYSAALQQDILGLGAQLTGPLLDVGCGAAAGLVLALRRRGVEAFGIDRFAVAGPYTECCDWFEYTFAPEAWGTIVSHLAFSHHFMHHHLKSSPEAAQYAQLYLKILRSLAPGGVFCYAPGLPFFEALLPQESYLVTRRPIENQRLYACFVQRR